MSIFLDHPRARWAVPGAVLACIAAGGLVTNQVASADPSLPPRTAAQLLVDVQKAQLSGLSGTVVQTSNLGLPDLPGMGGGGLGGGSSSLTSMVTGTHTWRVWYAGAHRARVALLGSLGESDVVRNGRDVWVWSSRDKTATHTVVAQGGAPEGAKPRRAPAQTPMRLPVTPQAAADQALAALDPSTSVTTSATTSVAGRDAYELVLSPKSTATTLVKQVRIAVDATQHIPLRVQVYSTKSANPAFEVSFSQVDFTKPDASRFSFNPPPGTRVTESGAPKTATQAPAEKPSGAEKGLKTFGTGWSTVLVSKVPQQLTSPSAGPNPKAGGSTDRSTLQLMALLHNLPRVSGAWGSGRLLTGTLFSVLLTDDGRMAVGAVPADQLYAALTAK